MKLLLTLFFIATTIFSETIEWKPFKENIDKPIFLYISIENNQNALIKKALSDKDLIKLINENFYPVKINPYLRVDLFNRYVHIKAPSIAFIFKNGKSPIQLRNITTITLKREILGFLEYMKIDKGIKKLEEDGSSFISKRLFTAYFLKPSQNVNDKRDTFFQFIKKYGDFKKGGLKFGIKKVMPKLMQSLLISKKTLFDLKIYSLNYLNTIINSKSFENGKLYLTSIKGWDKPKKMVNFETSINWCDLLIAAYNTTGDKKYLKHLKDTLNFIKDKLKFKAYIYDNKYKGITIDEYEILYLIAKIKFNKLENIENKDEIIKLKNIIDKIEPKPYLKYWNFYLRGSIFLSAILDKDEQQKYIDKTEKIIDQMVKNFFSTKKTIFYDSIIGKEPFKFKFVSIDENIETGKHLINFSLIKKFYSYTMFAKDILSFISNAKVENILNSDYIYLIEKYIEIEEEGIGKVKDISIWDI